VQGFGWARQSPLRWALPHTPLVRLPSLTESCEKQGSKYKGAHVTYCVF
jgi:hypothetical protein